jgi:hypothetical protein
VRASLRCSLDMYRFQLRLVLEKDGVVLRDRKILETLPDAIIFAHEFHDSRSLVAGSSSGGSGTIGRCIVCR